MQTAQFLYTVQMRFLMVDTADARGSVALFQGAEVVCEEAHLGEEDYSSWLLLAVRRTLAACSLSLTELNGYAVCAGPGSFTGLRVGLTTVKAWAEIYGRPIAAVSRLEAFALTRLAASEEFVAAFADARRNQVFAALYKRRENSLALCGEESVMRLSDFVTRVKREVGDPPVCWVSPDADLIRSCPEWPFLATSGHVLLHVAAPFAAPLGRLAARKFASGETVDAVSLDANYVRRSDAEVLWKGNKSALKLEALCPKKPELR